MFLESVCGWLVLSSLFIDLIGRKEIGTRTLALAFLFPLRSSGSEGESSGDLFFEHVVACKAANEIVR